MADKDPYDEEFQFSDPELNTHSEETQADKTAAEPPKSGFNALQSVDFMNNPVRKKALIAVLAFIGLFVLFKLFAAMFSTGDKPGKTGKEAQIQAMPSKQQMQPIQPANPVVASPSRLDSELPKIEQKLSSLESAHQNFNGDIDAIKNQVASLNANINVISGQLVQIGQVIATLSSKIEEQTTVAKTQLRKSRNKARHNLVHAAKPGKAFFIQAIIPGRAWLVSADGSAITVREGSMVPGYGVVRLIDPNQGRVVTSSGHMIRFSQQDS